MADTYALNANKGITFVRSPGLVFVTVTISDTYATSLGGLTLDFSTMYTQASPSPEYTIAHADVHDVRGNTTLGWLGVFTKSSTAGQWTMKLYNGITEQTEAAVTGTLKAILYVVA